MKAHAARRIVARGPAALSATLFVGFKVGPTHRWKLKDIVRVALAQKLRERLGAGGTFIRSEGYYQPDIKVRPINEHSAMVYLSNAYDRLPARAFVAHVGRIAARLRHDLRQEEVLVNINKSAKVWREAPTRR